MKETKLILIDLCLRKRLNFLEASTPNILYYNNLMLCVTYKAFNRCAYEQNRELTISLVTNYL